MGWVTFFGQSFALCSWHFPEHGGFVPHLAFPGCGSFVLLLVLSEDTADLCCIVGLWFRGFLERQSCKQCTRMPLSPSIFFPYRLVVTYTHACILHHLFLASLSLCCTATNPPPNLKLVHCLFAASPHPTAPPLLTWDSFSSCWSYDDKREC